jgi:hypothetical protein
MRNGALGGSWLLSGLAMRAGSACAPVSGDGRGPRDSGLTLIGRIAIHEGWSPHSWMSLWSECDTPSGSRTETRSPRCSTMDRPWRAKIRDVAIASRCLAALLGIVVTACGPVDVRIHVDWEGRTYIPVSICLDRSDLTDRALSVSASRERGSVPARPIVGIQIEQAIAVDTEEWIRCRSLGWVTAVADELSNEQEKVIRNRIKAVASLGALGMSRFVTNYRLPMTWVGRTLSEMPRPVS